MSESSLEGRFLLLVIVAVALGLAIVFVFVLRSRAGEDCGVDGLRGGQRTLSGYRRTSL